MALIDDVINALTLASQAAVANSAQVVAQAQAAAAINPTAANACGEGLTALGGARTLVAQVHEDAGRARALLTTLQLGTFLPAPTPAQLTAATLQRDNAVQAAVTADAAILAADPTVLAKHDTCTTLAPLLSCVTSGVNNTRQATEQVPNSITNVAGHLDAVVADLIANAAGLVPTMGGGCNQGVQLLANAATLIQQQTAAADLGTLQTCLSQLASVVPLNNPTLVQGQQALASSNAIINAAKALLDPGNPTTHSVWKNRLVCAITNGSLSVHVTDESGDNFGSGATVRVSNFPLNSMLPIDFPAIPAGSTNSHGRVTISGVPFAPMPLNLPANVPPGPTDLPTTDAATLIVSVTHKDKAPGSGAVGVDHNGPSVELHVPVDDSSL